MSIKTHEFIDYDLLMNLKDEKYGVEIVCYETMRWWVVPNPNDEQRVSAAEEQYRRGMYISKKRKTISLKDFDDDSIWRS